MKSVSDISCNVVATVSPVPFSVWEPKPDECFPILKSKWELKIQPVSSVTSFATETELLATSVYQQFNVAWQQCHKMNLKLQWEVVRNTTFVLCAFNVGWQKHTASLLWFLAVKNSAWKCSFGGAQISMQTQLFITILAAKMIRGNCLQEQPVLSGWSQVSLIWFWCVLVCWYVH